jgi:Protein of unknown function (DUF1559)
MRRPQIRFRLRTIMAVVAFSAVALAAFTWIGSLREAEAHTACSQNLKQIGLSLHNYASVNGELFPYGTIQNDGLPARKRLSWLVIVSGFLEQWFWIFDRSKSWDDDANRITRGRGVGEPAIVVERVRVFVCPLATDPLPAPMPGLTSYVGITGLGRDSASVPKNHPRAGCFGDDRQMSIGDFKDGLATTLAVVETTERGPWTAGGEHTLRGIDPARRPYIGRSRPFGGNHRGGVLVLFADGSVRFLRDSIEPNVFEALSTVAGGERLPNGWDQ